MINRLHAKFILRKELRSIADKLPQTLVTLCRANFDSLLALIIDWSKLA